MNGIPSSATSGVGRNAVAPPRWLERPFASCSTREVKIGKINIKIASNGSASLLRVTIPAAGSLQDDAFREAVYECYRGVGEVVRQMQSHPIRFWNYIPEISRIHSCGLSSYELFNAGRFDALGPWIGEITSKRLAVASGVGTPGDDFTLHLLTDSQPANPVENPRQLSPHCYSNRYGPVPPVFARACLLTPNQRNLFECSALVSGTASIVGEETRHLGDLARQIDETFLNLASLSDVLANKQAATRQDALDRYHALRIYVPRPENRAEIASRLEKVFRLVANPEFVEMDLCRTDLLLEVEGTLSFPA